MRLPLLLAGLAACHHAAPPEPAAAVHPVSAYAQARLASARLDVERLKAAYDEAVAEAGTARDSFETARTQDDRQQKLLGSGVVSHAG